MPVIHPHTVYLCSVTLNMYFFVPPLHADNRASTHAVVITSIVTVLSYVSGGLALTSANNFQLTLVAASLSLFVGAISAISKLKYFNFEAVAQQHSTALRGWNKL